MRTRWKITQMTRQMGEGAVYAEDGARVRDELGNDKNERREYRSLLLAPVGDDAENRSCFGTAFSGQIQLSAVDAALTKEFEIDTEVFLDFTPVG